MALDSLEAWVLVLCDHMEITASKHVLVKWKDDVHSDKPIHRAVMWQKTNIATF